MDPPNAPLLDNPPVPDVEAWSYHEEAPEVAQVVPSSAPAAQPLPSAPPQGDYVNLVGLESGESQEVALPPVGKWRDGLFGCFNNVLPTWLTSWVLPWVGLGQIARKMSYIGSKTYRTIVTIAVLLLVGGFVCDLLPLPDLAAIILAVASWAVALITFGATWYLRRATRRRYEIPGNACEDLCASMWCGCCVNAQMQRHLWAHSGVCDRCPALEER